MIKAIIFDLNGVFIKSRYLSERFREKFGVLEDDFVPALKDVMSKVRLPDVGSAFVYWRPYFEKWKVDITENDFFDFWFSGEKEVPEMTDLTRRLKAKGVKVFILSNNFRERTIYYQENFPFLREIAEKVYYSWQTGFVKPDEQAYRKLLSDNGLKTEEVVYFDDSEQNVKVATGLGISSFLFESPEQVENVLIKQGVSI